MTTKIINFQNKFESLGRDFYSKVAPTPVPNSQLVSCNTELLSEIGLSDLKDNEILEYFSGNAELSGGCYISTVYAGHQFGSYVSQLGDGRAIMVGEVNGYEIQLKGAGKTPYSRFGDGRAVLRSSIREYLCSEAMHYLGVPTTRALCVISSSEDVQREKVEKAAVVTRLSQSFIRFGHFEYFYYTNQIDNLRKLSDFVISNYYPNCNYDEFFEQVVLRTARLMAKWQAIGWSHGVMNTDNMSILGLTIDYGPFGFVDSYEPNFIPNHSDHTGRYAYDQQPSIGLWNLYALAQSLEPLIPVEKAAKILEKYQPELVKEYSGLMRQKLGFKTAEKEDFLILREILEQMQASHVDYTNFFRALSENENIRDMFIDRQAFDTWNLKYKDRLAKENNSSRVIEMSGVNPKYILRNYLAQNAILEAENGNYQEVNKLLNILKKPFDEQPENEIYSKEPTEWGRKLEISCSS